MNSTAKHEVLVFSTYFAPGFKAGGSVKTIINLIDALHEEIGFSVVTEDRVLGDARPYENIKVGEWQEVCHARTIYWLLDATSGNREVL